MMKLKSFLLSAVMVLAVSGASSTFAADKKAEKAKPYPLDKCVVSDEKLGEMGDPYIFVQDGQQIKLCCKSCLKDFKKDPSKYMKKLKKEAKDSKSSKSSAAATAATK